MLLSALLLLSVSSAAGDPDVLTVEHRFSGIICSGVCIDSDLRVQSDGSAVFRVRQASLEDRVWKTYRYRISPKQVRQFWHAYAAVRPVGLKGPIGACDRRTLVIDWDISWADSGKPGRLLACRGAVGVGDAYRDGFRILRISPVTGERLTLKQAESLR